MASSSSRSPSKALLFFFIASLILASFNLPVIFAPQFLKIKNTIEKRGSFILDKNVHIETIGFLPYGEAVLNNIKIQDIEIERLTIRFNILEFLIHKKVEEFHLKGVVVFKKPDFIKPVKYTLNTIITPDVISIGNLCLNYEKYSIDIKGNISGYSSDPRAEFNIASKEIDTPGFGRINNLYSELVLSKDELFIKGLNFFLDNFPLGVKCRVSDFKSPVVELKIISYPGQIPSLRAFNPMNFEISFSGKKTENAIKGSLGLESQKLLSVDPRKISYTRIKMEDLSCVFFNKAIFAEAKDIICETNASKNTFYLNASDFKASAYLIKSRIYLTGLNLLAYKGAIKGNGSLDLKQSPAGLLLDFKVYGMDIAEFAKALYLNYELKGDMYFSGVFNNRQDPCLSGRMVVKEGYLKNMQVLSMISDFLNVPSLKSVYFDQISALVYLFPRNKEVMFDKVTVSAKDINLKGSMKIKSTKKLNGNLSVRLPTALLKESFKLKLLFFIIGEKLGYQDFEFEIGGFAGSPQIKWLSTRFRENVMKYLTEGGKKSIESSLEKAIKQLL